MLVDKVTVPAGEIIQPGDEFFKYIEPIIQTQAAISKNTKIDRLYKAKINKEVFIEKVDSEPVVDAAWDVDGNRTVAYMYVHKLMSDETTAAALMKKAYLSLTYALIYDEMNRNRLFISSTMRDHLVSFLYAFFFRELGMRPKIVTQNKDELSIFEILVKKYILETIIGPIKPVSAKYLQKHLVMFNPYTFKMVMEHVEHEVIDDISILIDWFVKFKFLKEKKSVKDLISFAQFQLKTLFYIERKRRLLPFLFCIKGPTYGTFDEKVKKYNPASFGMIISEMYNGL